MTTRLFPHPVEQTQWTVDNSAATIFNWEYDEGREKLLNLYEKGKNKQWNTNTRLDWSQQVNPENPLGLPEESYPLYYTPFWGKMSEAAKIEWRQHHAAWFFSQFLHGEQGALICTAKIVQTVPQIDAKFYAATQVIDEARHVETYSRYLHEKLNMAYPINPSLKALLNDVLVDSRWDFTYLGMQVLIEGLALAAFHLFREGSQDPLAQALNAYVMQDEARHVAFGRLSLRDYYPQLTQKERDEREEFVVEACYLMRDRISQEEVYQNVGLNFQEVMSYFQTPDGGTDDFQKQLFSRIVPTIKDIGLWGPKVQRAFAEMGVIDFSQINPEELSAYDEVRAEEFDAMRNAKALTDEVIALGAAE